MDIAAVRKLDLKKDLKQFYSARTEPAVINVPSMKFLMVDGAGDPNTASSYRGAVEALYGVSYTLKFAVKRGPSGVDYVVMPLEGLWWAEDMDAFIRREKSSWSWTAMILQPDFITAAQVKDAVAAVRKKQSSEQLEQLRFETFTEGRAAQLMHIGSYDNEGPNIQRLHKYIAEQGGRLSGKHHEIYLSDPRRSAPDKLKTIIRQPFDLR